MNGTDYVSELKIDSLPKEKLQALTAIFNRMVNKGVDPLEFIPRLKELLDTPLLKLYELNTYSDTFTGSHAMVWAYNEVEARIAAAELDDQFLDNASCIEVPVKAGLAHYSLIN